MRDEPRGWSCRKENIVKRRHARYQYLEGDGVKGDLPPYWTAQLAAIIIVFSVGAALFPIGFVGSYYSMDYGHYWQPDYTYEGSFEANLTAASPMANISVGYCDTIEIYDQCYNALPVTLRVYNDTHHLFAMVQSFGGEPAYWSPASAKLHFATSQDYTVQVEREAEDTFFVCQIYAYVDMPLPPAIPIAIILFPYFGIEAFLMLFGLVLTTDFVRRTRTFYWTTRPV
jgi:hypothetical protein